MTDHRRKTYHGRNRRRGSTGGVLVTAVVLLAAVVLVCVCVLIPGGKDKVSAAAQTFLDDVKWVAGSAAESIRNMLPAGKDAGRQTAGLLPGDVSAESVPATRFSATEAAEEDGQMQSITVFKETEPETEAPPKYTENENTRLIGRESSAQAESAAADTGDASAAGTASGTGDASGSQADITLTFAGDILFDSHYAIMASLLQRSGGTPEIENAFSENILEKMRGADIFMVNNEFPYSNRGTPLENKKYTFRADPSYASLLSDMGVDIVSLANNHMYDHGEIALLDTLDTLTALDMPHIGAGRSLAEASAPFYFTNGQVKIGIVTATQIERLGNPDTKGATDTSAGVFRCMNSENLLNVIGTMQNECDFIIAYLHWGTESTEAADEWQKKLAVEVIEAGADLIIGDHPHVLQGISVYEGVPIVYSLGNFLFNSGAQDTCLVTASVDPVTAELISLQFIPARQESCRTKMLTGEEKTRVLTYMRSISRAEIDDEGFVSISQNQ